jgi:hypothetical protein
MATSIPERIGPPTAGRAKTVHKGQRKPRRASVAQDKATPRQKASHVKKAPKARTSAKATRSKAISAGSKTARILELLKRPGGATAQELAKETGWLPHSLRGFLSGIVGKKMGLTVNSMKAEGGERTYSIEASS